MQNQSTLSPTDGSIIIVLATDAPLSSRQLTRVIKRCGIGLGRTGSHFSHGSGDIVIGFTTAHCILIPLISLLRLELSFVRIIPS